MALTNMKIKKKKVRNEAMALPDENRERYPYGLEVSLNDESLRKLGLDVKDYDVKENLKLVCKAKITRLSSNENLEGEDNHMSLQITDLSVTPMAGLTMKQMRAMTG
jgi:hypothetical protein